MKPFNVKIIKAKSTPIQLYTSYETMDSQKFTHTFPMEGGCYM